VPRVPRALPPHGGAAEIKLDLARVDYWLGVGAQPSDTVQRVIGIARSAQPAQK